MAELLLLSIGWRTARSPQQRKTPQARSSIRRDAKFLEALPSWVSDAEPRLAFAREQLAADDAAVQSLLDDFPQYWSINFHKTLLPRHAFLASSSPSSTPFPFGADLLGREDNVLHELLLQPKTDAKFAEALCRITDDADAACHADLLDEYVEFSRNFRKGGLNAARVGDVQVLEAWLAHGFDPQTERDRRGASALHYAAGNGHVQCCALLCKAALDVDDRASDGATPLHWAVAGVTSRCSREDGTRKGSTAGGHPSTTEWLVQHGADVSAVTHDGNSIIHWCAWAGQRNLLEWLASEVNRRTGSVDAASRTMRSLNARGCSAAHWAASGGDLDTCMFLAEQHGVDFAALNSEGNTPLTKAIEHGREPVVQWLLTSGRCEAAVGEAAGYAARLAARHSADDVTERISELLQCYLVARHYLEQQRETAALAAVDFTPVVTPPHRPGQPSGNHVAYNPSRQRSSALATPRTHPPAMCTGSSKTNSPTAPRTTSCSYCGEHFSSRNRLYRHYREAAACGAKAVTSGLDIDAGRTAAMSKFAVSIGYAGSLKGEDAEEALRALMASQNRAGSLLRTTDTITITRASDWTFRRSRHFASPVSALEDVVIYSGPSKPFESMDSEEDKSAWLQDANEWLKAYLERRCAKSRGCGDSRDSDNGSMEEAGVIKLLDIQALKPSLSQLNAEQACTQRTYEYLLPLAYLETASQTASMDESDDPDAAARRLKATLRILSSPKSATRGGFRHRKSSVQEGWRRTQSWHNFARRRAVPTDAAVRRTVDRFWVHGEWAEPLGDRGENFLRLRVTADGVLDGQVERMVGTAVMIIRGALPLEFGQFALRPDVIVETPCAPRGLCYLHSVQYGWHAKQQSVFRRSRRDEAVQERVSAFEAAVIDAICTSEGASKATRDAWLERMHAEVCPRIVSAMEAQLERESRQQMCVNPFAADEKEPTVPSKQRGEREQAPEPYRRVLSLLREADESRRWPSTSRARTRVLSAAVTDAAKGGSFSAKNPSLVDSAEGAVAGFRRAPSRANVIFPELVEAIFELERMIAPTRPPSTMVAVNRRATFTPHTDAGSGMGQSTSLIVGLGEYSGGELAVEGESINIRYSPHSFDGWSQRHWTLPFEGERFSLVFFSPKEDDDGAGGLRGASRY